jgi:hypothetical protein
VLRGGGKKEGGIGAAFSLSSQARPQVARAVARGPAYKAGMRKGDLVLAIDGVGTLNMPVDQAAAMLRGPIGSAVRVEIEREGRALRFDVVRAPDSGDPHEHASEDGRGWRRYWFGACAPLSIEILRIAMALALLHAWRPDQRTELPGACSIATRRAPTGRSASCGFSAATRRRSGASRH